MSKLALAHPLSAPGEDAHLSHPSPEAWERLWAAYDEPTYQDVLQAIEADDVVLEIGAGDLRLARRIAEKARRVIAWEIQPDLLAQQAARLPENLTAVCTDARFEPVPAGVTAAVLLMRHCQHFDLYVKTLRMSGCRRLITNARWGLDVEVIDLQTPRRLYAAAPMGWYACWCGQTGFKPGRVEMFTPEMETAVHEVIDCPNCREN